MTEHPRLNALVPSDFQQRGSTYVAELNEPDVEKLTIAIWRNGDGKFYVDGDKDALFGCTFMFCDTLFIIGNHKDRITFHWQNDHVEQFLEWLNE